MKTIQIGPRGPKVSLIGFGTMGLGGRYEADKSSDQATEDLLREAIDLGVNIFDTAEVYADGHAETILGRAIADRREDIVIATKFSPANSTYNGVIKAAEASLKRLCTDYIDIYQNHWPSPDVPFDETLSALVRLVEDGKIRHVGLSNVTATEVISYKDKLPESFPLVSVQQEYNLAERFIEHSILPICKANELALIAYSPLGQGKLAEANLNNETLSKLSEKYDLNAAQICLQWVCRQTGVIAIPMTTKTENLRLNMACLDVEIDASDLALLTEAYAPDIREIPVDEIDIVGSHTGKAYTSIEHAKNNTLNISPSPVELSRQLVSGDILKPVKVRKSTSTSGRYELFEGQLRYWAWTIAHDGQRPILAQVAQ